jgi:hypothetical protein
VAATTPLTHVPVAAGPAYAERIERLPSKFRATLSPEPDNTFNSTAIAVHVSGEKIGYLPADLSQQYFRAFGDTPSIECAGRRAPRDAHEDTGIDVLLDLSEVPGPP